jgi:adenylosuccinate lyase
MPHKKNPISAENITGCARLLRSYGSAALEDVALWHERDISHSSVERVIFPDAFIICDYAVDRMQNLIAGLEVNKERMIENMALSQGQLFSSHLLLALVEAGQSREEAYANVQRLSHGLKPREALQDKVKQDAVVSKLLTHQQIDDVFSGRKHRESIVRELARRGLIETAKKG